VLHTAISEHFRSRYLICKSLYNFSFLLYFAQAVTIEKVTCCKLKSILDVTSIQNSPVRNYIVILFVSCVVVFIYRLSLAI